MLTLTNGSTITRDNPTKDFAGYSGPAVSIHLKPMGSGKQNELMVDGQAYEIVHSKAYDIVAENMTVHLYNDRIDKKGKAMGHWWIEIAATGAMIKVDSRSEIPTLTSTNFYVWGFDLSGTLQGAGGIGGLLCVSRISNGQISNYFPTCDGNGNISDYIDTNGVIVAHREYDPFGNTVVSSGPMKDDFSFWFSSKYLDQESGLYYYGFRYYSPSLERWLSRDPIGSRGGLNPYCFVKNKPTVSFDKQGLFCVTYSTSDADNYRWRLFVDTSVAADIGGFTFDCELYKVRDVIRHQVCTECPIFRDVQGTDEKKEAESEEVTEAEVLGNQPPIDTPGGWCLDWKSREGYDPPPTSW